MLISNSKKFDVNKIEAVSEFLSASRHGDRK